MDNVSPALEYQSLRDELLVAKKYVFERPLLIMTLGVAVLAGGGREYLAFLPVLMSGLLIFNLWFTVNRLRSAARIAAYIQLELEERRAENWIGWETALRKYRIWKKQTSEKQRKEEILRELQADAIPDALMYYPAIYRLHVALMLLALSGAIALFVGEQNPQNYGGLIATGALTIFLGLYLKRWAPKDLAGIIEENRAIWKIVLEANDDVESY